MSHPFKQSASGNRAGDKAQRSFEGKSQAREESSSRGSSTPSHAAGDGEVTGSQGDTVCVWFLVSNYVCDLLGVWLSLVAPLGTGIQAPSFSVSLVEVPRVFKGEDSTDCRVWLVLDVVQNFYIYTWGHAVTDWLGSRDISREQESCTQADFYFVFPSCLKFAFLKKQDF